MNDSRVQDAKDGNGRKENTDECGKMTDGREDGQRRQFPRR